MRTIFTTVLFVFIFGLSGFGQDSNLSRLIDEFSEINSEDLTARLEAINYELNYNPKAKGYIIIYRDKNLPFGFPIRFAAKLQNFFVKYLSLSPEQFEIINGGLIDERKTEIWISPDKSKPPLIDSTQKEFSVDKTALFDHFNYPAPYDGAGCCSIDGYTEEEKKASLDKFADQLKQNPAAQAYIIFYSQYCDDCSFSPIYSRSGKYLRTEPNIYLDSAATTAGILRKEKINFTKRFGIAASRVSVINGGYRKWQTMELWFVPKGGETPKAKPETFPGKKKRKK